MMVSVVFLRFSGKARSIVVWTTGGSSWCPVVGGEQRQCSSQAFTSSSGEGALLLMGGTKSTARQLCPRRGDLEQQQPAQKGRGQGPLLSTRRRLPPLFCATPATTPELPWPPNTPAQPSQGREPTPGTAHSGTAATTANSEPCFKGSPPGEGTGTGCSWPQARVTAVCEGESHPRSFTLLHAEQVGLSPQNTPANPAGTLLHRPVQVPTYEEPLVAERGDAALRVLDVGAGHDLTLPRLSHGHIIRGGAVDPGQRDALRLGVRQLVGHRADGTSPAAACPGRGQRGHSPPEPRCRVPGRSRRRSWPRASPRRAPA